MTGIPGGRSAGSGSRPGHNVDVKSEMRNQARTYVIAGQFAGAYSLAQANRNLAVALEDSFPGQVCIIPFGRPLEQAPPDVREKLQALAARRAHGGERILICQDWPFLAPPCEADVRLTLVSWEESRLARKDVVFFNKNFDALLTPSHFVKEALERSGVRLPVFNVGYAPDLRPFLALADAGPPTGNRPYTFLHVSSCLPRKGVDVLVRAFYKSFRRTDNVRLFIKGFDDYGGQRLTKDLSDLRALDQNAPEMSFIGKEMGQSDVLALYAMADCVVLPTRGEGFNLPAAEAIAAGKRLIVTGYGGHMDFVSNYYADFIKYRLTPSSSFVASPGSEWAEPDLPHLIQTLRSVVGHSTLSDQAMAARAHTLGLIERRKWIQAIVSACDQGRICSGHGTRSDGIIARTGRFSVNIQSEQFSFEGYDVKISSRPV